MKRRGELRMIQQAIRSGWDVPPAQLEQAKILISEIVSDSRSTERERATANQVATDIKNFTSGKEQGKHGRH
jgi:hypothetical protein